MPVLMKMLHWGNFGPSWSLGLTGRGFLQMRSPHWQQPPQRGPQELLNVPHILESMQKLTHALRLCQGMEHVAEIKFK